MKPLSPKSLEKKYAELGLSKAKTDLLHDYFLCFANLYGMLEVREAWNVFKHFEGNKIRKKDFIAFSGIYADEPAGMSDMRLIVSNDLIGLGYRKYVRIYHLADSSADKPIWLPDSKEELLTFMTDQFYLSPEGKKMADFLSKLKTDGVFKNYDGKPKGEILDIDGNPVKGKLRRLYKKTALKKVQDYIRMDIQIGDHNSNGIWDDLRYTLNYLGNDLGVVLTEKQIEQFVELYTNLNNHSHLWQNCGWKPHDLFRKTNSGLPKSISIGSNLQKLFDSGEIDREEFEKSLRQMGIKLIQ